jgi:hypothetical protein
MLKLTLSLAVCAAAPASLIAHVATTQPTSVEEHRVSTALDLLRAGDTTKALELTNDIEKSLRIAKAKPTDPAMVNCLHVRAVAQHRLGQFKPAADSIQRTALLASANRSLLVNLAVSDLKDLSLLPRSVKNLEACAKANPTDEEVVNLWGMAMAKLGDAGKVGDAKAMDWERAYNVVNTQLERTRPGSWHWGSQWIGQDEHSRIEMQRGDAQRAVSSAQSRVANAEQEVRDAKRQLAEAQAIPITARSGVVVASQQRYRDRRIADAEAAIERATTRLNESKAAVTRAYDGFPKPTWIATEQMVDPILIR